MLRVAICDDSRRDVERLESALERLEHYHIQWDVFYSGEELIEYKKKCENDYDLYIFDVEMPGMNGIEVAARIRKEDVRAIFVFLTSHTEYALSAIDVITLAYIQKPITPEKVNELFNKIEPYFQNVNKEFSFKIKTDYYRVRYDEILYLEREARRVNVYTINEVYKAYMKTDEIWKQLDSEEFAVPHASYIVNLRHVRTIKGDFVILADDTELPISRTCKQEFKEKHLNYIKRMV